MFPHVGTQHPPSLDYQNILPEIRAYTDQKVEYEAVGLTGHVSLPFHARTNRFWQVRTGSEPGRRRRGSRSSRWTGAKAALFTSPAAPTALLFIRTLIEAARKRTDNELSMLYWHIQPAHPYLGRGRTDLYGGEIVLT